MATIKNVFVPSAHILTHKLMSLLHINRLPVFLQGKDHEMLHFSYSDPSQWNPLEQEGTTSIPAWASGGTLSLLAQPPLWFSLLFFPGTPTLQELF